MSRDHLKTVGQYIGAVALSVLILTWAMKLWKADLAVPFHYGGDALFYSVAIKGTIENGWYLKNDAVGVPSGLRMHDFPLADALNFLILKALGFIRPEYAWVLNVFFLLTFPLTTITSLFAFLQFRLSYFSALVWSLVYTFIPFHFIRGEGHLFVTTYYLVPLAITVALWIATGSLHTETDHPSGTTRKRRLILSVVFCLLISSVGIGYYAFFSCFFILLAGVIAAISYRQLRPLVISGVLIVVVCAGLLANLTPNLIYMAKHGDIKAAQRGPHEAETFGLKVAQLLLPVQEHRLPALARVAERYSKAPLVNENRTAALGFVGAVGFLTLLAWFLFLKPDASNFNSDNTRSLLNNLSLMNLAALLLATVGGFSALFALLISPQMRTYNRISVYISFFSIFAVATLIENRFRKTSKGALTFRLLLALILAFAILDQTSPYFVPDYNYNKSQFDNDKEFVETIQSMMSPGAMIFQLPYMSFPEHPAVSQMTDYELFRGYLHSKTLGWSYGTMKGREGDLWLRDVSARPVEDMLQTIAFAGFSGIYIDRTGMEDRGVSLESNLTRILGTAPIVSRNQRLVFFNLTGFVASLKNHYSPEELAIKRELAIHPITLRWQGGFSDLETGGDSSWRWCSSAGQLRIMNPLQQERKILVEMDLISGGPEFSNMNITSPSFSDHLLVNHQGKTFSQTVTVAPGESLINFYCDGQRIDAPKDERVMVFRVMNFRWKELE
jgi:phosphoglycerol transferase